MYVRTMQIIDSEQLRQWARLDAEQLADQQLVSGVVEIMQAENVLGALRMRLLAQIDNRALAKELGFSSTPAWLTHSGRVDAGVAKRQVAVSNAMNRHPRLAELFGAGEIRAAHAEAITTAIAAIDIACPRLPDAGRATVEAELVRTALAHTPSQVRERGRALLFALQPDRETGGDDPDRNRLDYGIGRDGRGHVRGDLDRLTFEKLRTAIEPLAEPRPAENGTPDERDAARRRADALADVLDSYLGHDSGIGSRKTQVTLIAEANELAGKGRFVHNLDEPGEDIPTADAYRTLFDAEWPFHLSWTGSVSRQVAQMLACDCDVTVVLVDGKRVPLDVGRTERLVTKPIRTALIVRDEGCAMPGCGRPAQWCDAHHIIEWVNGGETSLANMVLLCRQHHRTIHRGGWQVSIADDGHPWFVPPPTVDPARQPRPAHNRRCAGADSQAA
jgi:hypothetical protein